MIGIKRSSLHRQYGLISVSVLYLRWPYFWESLLYFRWPYFWECAIFTITLFLRVRYIYYNLISDSVLYFFLYLCASPFSRVPRYLVWDIQMHSPPVCSFMQYDLHFYNVIHFQAAALYWHLRTKPFLCELTKLWANSCLSSK